MPELILLRHGKSDWDAPFDDDRDRPLAPRGVEAAEVMGRVLTLARRVPDLILTSPARRARDTARLAARAGGWEVPIRHDDLLCPGSPDSLLQAVSRQAREEGRLLVVGHEPALSATASLLLGGASVRMATGTAAAFSVASWAEVGPGTGTLLWMLPPRLFTDGGFHLG